MRTSRLAAMVALLAGGATSDAVAQDSRPTPEFLDGWSRWSADTWKKLQDSKVLLSADLDYCKVMTGVVERKLARAARAAKLEEAFEENAQANATQALASIDAALKGYVDNGVVRRKDKKNAIAELEKMKQNLALKLSVIGARRQLFQEVGQNFSAMHVKAQAAIKASKAAKDKDKGKENEKKFLADIEPLERHAAVISSILERDGAHYDELNKRSERIDETIELIQST